MARGRALIDARVEGQRRADDAGAEGTVRRADMALSTDWKGPETAVEHRLAEIWREVLRIDAVGVLDDFFDLGGDSFTATTLAVEIEAAFDMRFRPADIINLPTVAQQAEAVAKARSAAPKLPACLILGRAGGPKPPLFIVHQGKGFAFVKPEFLDILAEDRSTYLFQAPGLDARITRLEEIEKVTTVEAIAKSYVDAMRTIQPTGPYHLASICAGSFIALEMCHQLEKIGQAVGRLILLDPTPAPPMIKPPIKPVRESKPAKPKTLRAQLLRFFSQKQGRRKSPEQLMRGESTETIQREIKRRVEQMKNLPPEERSYTEERMLKVSQQFRAALYRHVPRPYSGKAVMVVSAARVNTTFAEKAFWPNHLGSMQYEVVAETHKDIFEKNLRETARFVKDALN